MLDYPQWLLYALGLVVALNLVVFFVMRDTTGNLKKVLQIVVLLIVFVQLCIYVVLLFNLVWFKEHIWPMPHPATMIGYGIFYVVMLGASGLAMGSLSPNRIIKALSYHSTIIAHICTLIFLCIAWLFYETRFVDEARDRGGKRSSEIGVTDRHKPQIIVSAASIESSTADPRRLASEYSRVLDPTAQAERVPLPNEEKTIQFTETDQILFREDGEIMKDEDGNPMRSKVSDIKNKKMDDYVQQVSRNNDNWLNTRGQHISVNGILYGTLKHANNTVEQFLDEERYEANELQKTYTISLNTRVLQSSRDYTGIMYQRPPMQQKIFKALKIPDRSRPRIPGAQRQLDAPSEIRPIQQ